jgi:hypothetical protein
MRAGESPQLDLYQLRGRSKWVRLHRDDCSRERFRGGGELTG